MWHRYSCWGTYRCEFCASFHGCFSWKETRNNHYIGLLVWHALCVGSEKKGDLSAVLRAEPPTSRLQPVQWSAWQSGFGYIPYHSFIVVYVLTIFQLHVKRRSPRPKPIITKLITRPPHLVAGKQSNFESTVYVMGTAVSIFIIAAKRWT